jgi:O-antigen ligase
MESLTSGERIEKNLEARKLENEYALKKIAGHPLFGIGFVSPYRPQIYGPDDKLEWYIHNGYLWILLKLGIAGLIPFLWFSYVFVRRGIKYWNQVEDDFLRPVVLGSVCLYLAIAVGNYAAPHFIASWEMAVFGLSMGINEVIYRLEGVDAYR